MQSRRPSPESYVEWTDVKEIVAGVECNIDRKEQVAAAWTMLEACVIPAPLEIENDVVSHIHWLRPPLASLSAGIDDLVVGIVSRGRTQFLWQSNFPYKPMRFALFSIS